MKKINTLERYGIYLLVVAIIVAYAQTRTFGNHLTSAEAIVQLTCILIMLVGYVMHAVGRYLRLK